MRGESGKDSIHAKWASETDWPIMVEWFRATTNVRLLLIRSLRCLRFSCLTLLIDPPTYCSAIHPPARFTILAELRISSPFLVDVIFEFPFP
jgi:hypothetical protein